MAVFKHKYYKIIFPGVIIRERGIGYKTYVYSASPNQPLLPTDTANCIKLLGLLYLTSDRKPTEYWQECHASCISHEGYRSQGRPSKSAVTFYARTDIIGYALKLRFETKN
jgi:hypothetical protein